MQRLRSNIRTVGLAKEPVRNSSVRQYMAILLSAASFGTVLLGPAVVTFANTSAADQTATPSSTARGMEQVAAGPMSIAENRLVLNLRSRRLYLYQGDALLTSYPVAVGTAETPTPQGEFTVSRMVENPIWQSPWTGEVHEPGPDSALGLRWIEFSTTEAGSFGFHGTPTVESIGHAASNGCVRMHNEDVVALFAQVSIGTPVSVVP